MVNISSTRQKLMSKVIQSIITRIDTTANWKTLNPIPKNGEQCIEDLGGGLFKLKVGDGVTPWIALKYKEDVIIGNLSDLNTPDNKTIVGAINSLEDQLSSLIVDGGELL
jgi:hypothetical protein